MASCTSQRVIRTASIRLTGTPDSVFPLFEPLGEKLWVKGWDPAFVYPPRGATEAGAVFTTRHANGHQAVWVVVAYDPSQFQVTYVRVEPHTHVAQIVVRCTAIDTSTTRADVTYTFTGLTEAGNAYVATFTEEHYLAWLAQWETAINDYLRKGEGA